MVYKSLKELSVEGKGFYGIGASSCECNDSFPSYLRITDISDSGNIPSELPTCIDTTIYPDFRDYLLHPNDILFARTGNSTGRNFFVEKLARDTVFAGFLIKFSLNPESVNPKYVQYYCQSLAYQNQIKSIFTGSTRPNVNAEQYGELKIPVPDSKQQQHIVNTIGSIDDLIEKLKGLIDKIEHLLDLLYREQESVNTSTFSDCFFTTNGGSYKSSDYSADGEYKLITIKNINDDGFNSESTDRLTKEKIINKTELLIGDVLLTMTGNVGRIGIVDECKCLLNQRVLKIKCMSSAYLYCYLKDKQRDFVCLGRGTAQKNLSLAEIKCMPIENSKEEIQDFMKHDPLFNMILRQKIIIKKLFQTKKRLLELFFG